MLETLALAAIDALAPEDQVLETEPDPLEERLVAQVDTVPTPEPGSPLEVAPDSDADAALFGEIWPLGEKVKLDPTVDRGVFRQQRDRLKALGYTFRPLGQVWTFAIGERGA